MVHIGHTSCQLTRTRSRSRHNDQIAASFDVVIFPHPFRRDDVVHISRIALDRIVEIRGDPALVQLFAKGICCSLSSILGDDDRAYKDPQFIEFVDQAQYFLVIRNS